MFFVFVGRLMEYLKGKLGYKIALGSAYGSGKNGGRRWCKEEKDKKTKKDIDMGVKSISYSL